MARFGQGLIQALTNPSYQQGMFNLGSAIGSAPAQRRDQQAKSTAMTMVNEALASQDPDKLLQAANAIKTMDPATATKLSQAAGQLRTQRKQAGVAQLEQGQQETNANVQKAKAIREAVNRGDRESARLIREGLLSVEDYSKKLTESQMSEADRYKVVGNNIFDVQTGDYIEPSVAGDKLSLSQLKDVATPDSVIEYAKTGNVNVLKPLAQEEEEGPTATELGNRLAEADNTITTVKEAAGLAEEIYPLFYDITKYAPGTAARSLDNRIDTLKANLSFDRLKKMKEESKTGGALGQVSNVELRLLGSTVASLDPTQPDFPQQLKKVEDSYSRFKNALLGKMPPGDKYVEDNGVLYYEDDEGNFISLGALQ